MLGTVIGRMLLKVPLGVPLKGRRAAGDGGLVRLLGRGEPAHLVQAAQDAMAEEQRDHQKGGHKPPPERAGRVFPHEAGIGHGNIVPRITPVGYMDTYRRVARGVPCSGSGPGRIVKR
ncbi:hypothetical protein GBA63_22030 (plasmid) [Rubrobacter tropicus]|uniref:Uncharacterized protein n=1 Tax=Rubrobacter tropicus TaxID=2653851 RepID=A0A6G8QG59_9ACTN|nr:hypothetical protein [Rubrobacter tropicus]QIN85391.1 hypothetical protein GBA63_22030 [Rubrobacter tropicus]